MVVGPRHADNAFMGLAVAYKGEVRGIDRGDGVNGLLGCMSTYEHNLFDALIFLSVCFD